MIFVTLGTHEQPFNRLIQKIEDIKKKKLIEDEVVIQSGYTDFQSEHCVINKIMPVSEMERHFNNARIVICHGGTGSIFGVLSHGKIPIVVPRQHSFGEHVDNHQVEFSKFLEKKNNIIAIYDIEMLEEKIINYTDLVAKINIKDSKKNNEEFVKEFEKIVEGMMNK